MKLRRAVGPDGLLAGHLKAGGDSVVVRLMTVLLNAVMELEAVKRRSLCVWTGCWQYT